MSDSLVMTVAGAGAAFVAAAGALSKGTLVEIGVALIFIAAASKFISRKKQHGDRRNGPEDRRHAEDQHAVLGSRQ
jgi:hypothetical protein